MAPHRLDSRFIEIARKARRSSEYSQRSLAVQMADLGFNWGQQTVARFEMGRRSATVGEAAALAVLLDLKISLPDLAAENLCGACDGDPPRGFTCNECGRSTA